MMTGIPKLGKYISVSAIIDKFKVTGSIARMMIQALVKSGGLSNISGHSRQYICVPLNIAPEKVATKAEDTKKDTKKVKAPVKKEK